MALARRARRPAPMRRADFLRATREGRRGESELFLLLLLRRDDGGDARLGITASRRVGIAVRRNRIKRLVREWFRQASRDLRGCDVVVIARRALPERIGLGAVQADLDRIARDLRRGRRRRLLSSRSAPTSS